MKAQRLRFRYRLLAPARELRHREIVSAWESAVRASGLDLAYSQGKRPAPQISLAAPLPLGATSDAELMDLCLATRADPAEALSRIAGQLPDGLEAVSVSEIGVNAPSLQSVLRWAEYEADVPSEGISREDAQSAIERFLSSTSVIMEHRNERKTRDYDLRPLVLDLRLAEERPGVHRLRMRLRAEQEATARADQTCVALGLPEPARVHRTKLTLDDSSAAIQAYRRQYEPEVRY